MEMRETVEPIRDPSRRPPESGMPVGFEGFAAFYRETLPRLYGYFVTRCGGNVAVAEDLTQETYVAFVRQLRDEREVASAAAWLLGIARHKLVDHYRRQRRLEAIREPWDARAAEAMPAPVPDPIAAATAERVAEAMPAPVPDPIAAATAERVAEAMARLPESQRIVVALRELDGLSVGEVAAALGKSVHAVESLLARARVNLRRHLIDEGHPR